MKPPAVRKRHQLHLTADQLDALAVAVDEHGKGAGGLIHLLGYGGLRWGEAVALRWENVDTARRLVRVKESANEIAGRRDWGAPKTHEVRTVIVPQFVIEGLGQPGEGLVFTAPKGGPLRHSNFSGGMGAGCETAGMADRMEQCYGPGRDRDNVVRIR